MTPVQASREGTKRFGDAFQWISRFERWQACAVYNGVNAYGTGATAEEALEKLGYELKKRGWVAPDSPQPGQDGPSLQDAAAGGGEQ